MYLELSIFIFLAYGSLRSLSAYFSSRTESWILRLVFKDVNFIAYGLSSEPILLHCLKNFSRSNKHFICNIITLYGLLASPFSANRRPVLLESPNSEQVLRLTLITTGQLPPAPVIRNGNPGPDCVPHRSIFLNLSYIFVGIPLKFCHTFTAHGQIYITHWNCT